jgi:hypothetical protein
MEEKPVPQKEEEALVREIKYVTLPLIFPGVVRSLKATNSLHLD